VRVERDLSISERSISERRAAMFTGEPVPLNSVPAGVVIL